MEDLATAVNLASPQIFGKFPGTTGATAYAGPVLKGKSAQVLREDHLYDE